jgi:probable HAF family extracellular repeat protein
VQREVATAAASDRISIAPVMQTDTPHRGLSGSRKEWAMKNSKAFLQIQFSRRAILLALLLGFAVICFRGTPSCAQAHYSVTDLGTSLESSVGWDINSSGEATGYSYGVPLGMFHAFFYSRGVLTDLGTLPGGTRSWGRGINSLGHVTGYGSTQGLFVHHAFVYRDGILTDLGTPAAGDSNRSNAWGINDSGQISGLTSVYPFYGPSFIRREIRLRGYC